MNQSIKKYIIGAVIVGAFAAYAIFGNNNGTGTTPVLPLSSTTPSPSSTTQVAGNTTTSATTTSASNPPSGTPPASTVAANGAYKDGTYTGTVADAFYGNLQVVAVIRNGKLADMQFPVYPSDSNHSRQISNSALPVLKQEAITAQSANVDVVSGATQLSQAFQQSLASALGQA